MIVGIFAVGIIIYAFKLIKFMFGTCRCRNLAIVFLVFCSIIEFACYIIMIVLYCITLSAYNQINPDLLKFARDKNCSDAVLQRALSVYSDSF